MAKILFASNNIAHFPGSVANSLSGSFSSSRVPYGIGLTEGQLAASPEFTPSEGTVTSFHFVSYAADTPNSDFMMFGCYDSLNRPIARLFKVFNVATYQNFVLHLSNGASTITANCSTWLTEGRQNFIDIIVTVNLSQIKADVYFNGFLSATLNFAANLNNITNPVKFILGGALARDTVSTRHIFSEIIVADADTRNARLNLLRPATTGGFDEWGGAVSNLADDDNSTGVFTTLPNQRQTVGLTAYSGAEHIANLVAVSQTVRGQNSPSKLRHTIRIGGMEYDSADIDLPFTPKYNITDFEINPATSLAWTSNDLLGIETGFLSVA